MKKKMITLTMLFFAGLLACGITYYFTRVQILFPVTITFGTCFYHFAIRLVVGHSIDAIYRNQMNYHRWWFQERKFESKLYKFLQVRKWRKYMPTYHPEYYDMRKHSIEEIIQVTCQSEVVHEVNMMLSFVPIMFTIWFDSLAAFLITSTAACCFDSVFVIMQRYHRPKWKRLLRR